MHDNLDDELKEYLNTEDNKREGESVITVMLRKKNS